MERKGWYLVAYDIADPRRLVKIHRLLKKEGLAVQKSVFFTQGTESRLNRLLDCIADMMTLKEDDLRAYPITHPRDVWTNSSNPLADFPVMHMGKQDNELGIKHRARRKTMWWKRILGS